MSYKLNYVDREAEAELLLRPSSNRSTRETTALCYAKLRTYATGSDLDAATWSFHTSSMTTI